MIIITPSPSLLVPLLESLSFSPLLTDNWQYKKALIVDLTANSEIWSNLKEKTRFEDLLSYRKKALNAKLTIGRYNEERVIYQDRAHFTDTASRSLHLGIDLGAPAGLAVLAPLDGVIHSFADNRSDGDYGPTMILQHCIDGIVFHTLYGHLSRHSLSQKQPGMKILQGMSFATIGNSHENGGWAPHIHFQIIQDMQGYQGDYPGVVNPELASYYLANCPDPNLILKRPDL